MKQVIVVGGGAAGMMAAITSARNGHRVTLLEQNEKLGKKLFITGKGRCNITNASDMDVLFSNVITNKKFLYSAFYQFDNYQTIAFFEELGLKTKIERGERVFPESDKSSDVIAALQKELKKLEVKVLLYTKVEEILEENGHTKGVIVRKDGENKVFKADAVIVATGGISYPSTGSTGDGYRLAKDMGHQVTKLYPALVPFEIEDTFVKGLQGLSLKNVGLTLFAGKKKIYDGFGEMLFTHFGISGPLVLSASSYVSGYIQKQSMEVEIDLKPALTEEQLHARILRDFEEIHNKQFKNGLDRLLPQKLIPVIVELSGIQKNKSINSVTKEERNRLVNLLKHFRMVVKGLRGYNEAIITKGGISVKDINPQTMESKIINGLYFVGEVLDLDALTGGYNLQIAWSTGYLAGISIGD
ncbi:MAG: NAD(P)/FAD-dependent oxidoreductase [Lachnospiraceae bacterium]|nr:NAD(P)/FAD-dependent oxidoreductase [Lachnospiraceae bacterium]